MRRAPLVVIVAGTVVLAASVGAIAKRHGGPCPTSLGSNVYRCTVKAEDGSSFVDCYRFSTGGLVSTKFEFSSDRLGATVGCACQPGGKPARPVFGSSADFSCTSDLGVAFLGRVKHNGAITKGAATNAQGGAFAFACAREDGCSLP